MNIDTKYEGFVILGKTEIVVDALIYSEKYGSLGNTINFKGTNIVIIGLSIRDLGKSAVIKVLDEPTFTYNYEQARLMIRKLKKTLDRPDININLEEDTNENVFLVFARRNFFLMETDNKTIVINNRQISIIEGENKLIEIDPKNGILVADSKRVISLGIRSKDQMSILGQFGVNLVSRVLKDLVWD